VVCGNQRGSKGRCVSMDLVQPRRSFDGVAAPVALALGFSLVGLVLVVIFPLVCLAALCRRAVPSNVQHE
jgi:hypothetical protein